MKKKFWLSILLSATTLFLFAAGPRTFYFSSSSGNDANTGIISSSPWQSIAKLNALIPTLVGDDTVKFLRGDIFVGRILITKNGSQGHNIIFDAYGPGTTKPEITSIVTITGWTNLGGNIWEANTSGVNNNNNLVIRDGVIQRVGRTPNYNAANGGYLVYTAATSTSLTTPSLSTTKNWAGAEVAIRNARWEIRRRIITTHSGGVLTFPILGTTTNPITPKTPGYGYFFQREASTLDQDGEWYQNGNKLRMYFANNNPNVYTIKAATLDTIIHIRSSYITIQNIKVSGGNVAGIYSDGGTGILIDNTDVIYNGGEGIVCWFGFNITVRNCFADQNLGGGIKVYGAAAALPVKNYRIENCLVKNSCLIPGMTRSDVTNSGRGINIRGGDSLWCLNNTVINSGYNGIDWHGNHVYVKYNLVDTFCTALDDGAGIYTFEASGSTIVAGTVDRNIVGNIIDHGIGNLYGGGSSPLSANGIYLDEGTRNVVIDSNVINKVSLHGLQGNNNSNITITRNIVKDAFVADDAWQRLADGPPLTGFVVSNNEFDGYRWRFRDQARNLPTTVTTVQNLQRFGTRSGNYHSLRSGVDTSLMFQSETNPRVNSPSSYVQSFNPFSYLTGTVGTESGHISFANTGTLHYNQGPAVRTVLFSGQSYITPRGVVYNNFANIQPHTGVILLSNGTINGTPTANAGPDKIITLPTSSVTVNGSGTDDGTITGYSWAKASGPPGGTIASPTSATTNITALQAGVYLFTLTVTDNGGLTNADIMQITVNAANVAPIANAGSDITITSPASTTTLTGSGADADGSISSYGWVKISGPAGGTITSPSSASTGLTALGVGTYVYQLTVTDNGGLTHTDAVQVIVNAANVPPTASAGSNITITLPVNSTTLNGSGTDVDGTIVSYAWTKESGPTGGAITSPSSASTGITSLQAGTYVYKLTVTDNGGLTGSSSMQITVNAAANIAPTANAGTNQTITLPTNTTTLSGSGTDADGTITGYSWSKLSGPAGGTLTAPTSASTGVSSLIQGTYVFQLVVTDNNGATGAATVQVVVEPAIPPANEPPTVNAGRDTAITLPTSSVLITAIGADIDGTISAYFWRKISGPVSYTISSPNSASTIFSGLTVGTYTFQVRVTDNDGDTAVDEMQVRVNPANQAPTAIVGSNLTVTLPTSTAPLTGSGTDQDGTIVSYSWTKVSGPTGGSIVSPSSANTSVTGLTAGVYLYQLTVTDDDGATGSATMQITVNAANIAPTASAGSNITITSPVSTATLNGSGTDVDGTISSYAWVKLDGPTGGAITSPSSASTGITGLVVGVYTYQLTVTDDDGAIGTASVQVTVTAANIAPVVSAGADTIIILPINSINLTAIASDAEGPIVSYSWAQVSGPSSTIASPAIASTDILGLTEGVYVYEVTVTDEDGATASDVVQVTVLEAVNSSPIVSVEESEIAITMPNNSVTLVGSGSDAEGSITYQWTGNGGTIETPTDSLTVVSGLTPGTYTFILIVTDEDGATAAAPVTVTVNPAPLPNEGPGALILIKTFIP